MAKRFPRFLIGLKNWMFPSSEDQEYSDSNGTDYQVKNKTDSDTYYPRLQKQNSPEPKVIHQYPKKGNFRFPVIKDEEPAQKRGKIQRPPEVRRNKEKPSFKTEQYSTRATSTERKERKPAQVKKDTENHKPRFQGKDFYVRSVPSPVYGFNKPPVRKQNTVVDEENRDEQRNQAWSTPEETTKRDLTEDYAAEREPQDTYEKADFLPPSSPHATREQEKEELLQNDENETEEANWFAKEKSKTVTPIQNEETEEAEFTSPDYKENETAETSLRYEETEAETSHHKAGTERGDIWLQDEENETETAGFNNEKTKEEYWLQDNETAADDEPIHEAEDSFYQEKNTTERECNSEEEDAPAAAMETETETETEIAPSKTVVEQADHETETETVNSDFFVDEAVHAKEEAENQFLAEGEDEQTFSAYNNEPVRTEEEEVPAEVKHSDEPRSEAAADPSPGEENTLDRHAFSRKKDKKRKGRHRIESTSPAAGSDMKKAEGNRQSNIPFNVLMNRSDRVKVKRREEERKRGYAFPSLQLLDIPPRRMGIDDEWVTDQVSTLNETFDYFRIRAKVVHVTKGPSVTRFEIQPEPGVKVSKITNLTDDLKLSLAAKEIRIEAPIPGKSTIGIEVPNKVSEPVFLREILHHKEFRTQESPLTAALGMDITGEPVVTDLQKMPHGLIAGATGSGKSVCVNSILVSLLYKASPEEVRLLLIDPKMVELAPYNGIPHLAAPVITDPKEATEGLKWAVGEMERRYELFAKEGSRDLKRFNKKMKEKGQEKEVLPYLVVVVDELADLMMVAPHDVEEAICRLAQKARACGIHLLVATQRPSVDVITGLIKSNIPTRIAFSVSSQADSRTIIDSGGAERLLGRGDMLFMENGSGKPVRIQGTFVSDEEIDRVMEYVKQAGKAEYLFERENLQKQIEADSEDDLFEPACDFVYEQQAASASLLQRHFRIGYNRAARLIDEMEERGIISSAKGSKPREVYLTKEGNSGKIGVRGDT
ncbi:DNA translocase FtsK [Evansella sp. LMS18]|uniref:DNA translocase FtsK n=1 Tax=Evansella sp. LMS18 TaxID=2924033 RepID=UPI0026F10D8C|nr:DNA translocase FtsK [Evansella sp. LMS18]